MKINSNLTAQLLMKLCKKILHMISSH